jgi:hypothetical protein
MPAEIDFSGGTRGKFYRLGTTLNLPVYLEAEVQNRLTRLANAQGHRLLGPGQRPAAQRYRTHRDGEVSPEQGLERRSRGRQVIIDSRAASA